MKAFPCLATCLGSWSGGLVPLVVARRPSPTLSSLLSLLSYTDCSISPSLPLSLHLPPLLSQSKENPIPNSSSSPSRTQRRHTMGNRSSHPPPPPRRRISPIDIHSVSPSQSSTVSMEMGARSAPKPPPSRPAKPPICEFSTLQAHICNTIIAFSCKAMYIYLYFCIMYMCICITLAEVTALYLIRLLEYAHVTIYSMWMNISIFD